VSYAGVRNTDYTTNFAPVEGSAVFLLSPRGTSGDKAGHCHCVWVTVARKAISLSSFGGEGWGEEALWLLL